MPVENLRHARKTRWMLGPIVIEKKKCSKMLAIVLLLSIQHCEKTLASPNVIILNEKLILQSYRNCNSQFKVNL